MPQPARVDHKLIDDLNRLLRGRVEDITATRIRREVEKLKHTDPEIAYVILGMLGCVLWNEHEMRYNHENALKIAPKSVVAHLNYCTSLAHMNFFAESAKRIMSVSKFAPHEPDVVDIGLQSIVRSGRILDALEYVEAWNRIRPGEEHPLAEFVSEAAKIFAAHKIDCDQSERVVEIIGAVARERRIRVGHIRHLIMEEEGGLIIFDWSLPYKDAAKVEEFNLLFVDRLVEQVGGDWPEQFIHTFSAQLDEDDNKIDGQWPLTMVSS